MTIFDDLAAEEQRLADILTGLDEGQWATPSAAAGWTIADVVLHLAQSEEAVEFSAAGTENPTTNIASRPDGLSVDGFAAWAVQAERAGPEPVLQRWRRASTAALDALRAADPQRPLRWVAAPLKPATLATTRLAEHWAHGLDISGPLGVDFADTERLRHIAWLAHRTLPYAFALAGHPPAEITCELTGPDGAGVWRFGPPDGASVISGQAGAFCRVAAQRLTPAESGLTASDRNAELALDLVRTYAA